MAPKRTPKVAAHAIPHESPLAPQVGDKVIPERSESTYIVTRVSPDGSEVDLSFPGTNIERFRVKTATLRFVDRMPQPTRPAAKGRPTLNAGEVTERIASVQHENLQRLDDDIDILTKYLKTEGAPKATIDALNRLSSEQRESWKAAIERITELLED
ncbi:MAG TPA: hypothetical protein VK638_45870 [Edaphobacter sp.]|nr:hypothetical protein [Edaphobacter sp.]